MGEVPIWLLYHKWAWRGIEYYGLGSELSDTADREAVVAVVVVGRVDASVEVEVVSLGAIRVGRRGPIVSLVAGVAQLTIVEAPAIR